MNCKQARAKMQDLMDRDLTRHAELEGHLAECAACRAEMSVLERLDTAVQDTVSCDVSAQALERITTGALSGVPVQPPPASAAVRRTWLAVAAAAALATFVVGLAVGRWFCPRELTVTRVVSVPELRDRIVEVRVPVVEERVVVQRIPVVRTRVVYRDREATGHRPIPSRPSEPVKLEELVVRMDSPPMLSAPTLAQEVRPAKLAADNETRAPGPTQTKHQQSNTPATQAFLAEAPPSGTSPGA